MAWSTRPLWLAFVAGLTASGAMGANCNPQSVFACSTDEDCLGQGEGGVCEANNMCSFPDLRCPSGRRWHDRAPSEMAGECLGGDTGADETEGDDESGDSGTSDPSTTTTTSTTDASASSPDDDASASADDAADGDESSTGMVPSCDEQYGGAPDYLLCEETPESCSFNATIANTISCNDVCSMFGGTCIEAHLNEEDLCLSTGPASCDQNDFNDGICVCTRG
jgi:hypothetical protein